MHKRLRAGPLRKSGNALSSPQAKKTQSNGASSSSDPLILQFAGSSASTVAGLWVYSIVLLHHSSEGGGTVRLRNQYHTGNRQNITTPYRLDPLLPAETRKKTYC